MSPFARRGAPNRGSLLLLLAVLSAVVAAAGEAHPVSVCPRLADCETGDGDGRPPYRVTWRYDGKSGYDGGYQFHPRTWRDNKPSGYPAFAYQASPAQQTFVAKRLVRRYGWASQFPACSRKLGLR